jgi:hypothetical protein
MADMHRPGRVGGDIFDIGLPSGANLRTAIIRAGCEHRLQSSVPEPVRKAQVDEAGTGDLNGRDIAIAPESCRDLLCQRARIFPDRLRQDHRGIGRQIAMGRVARRLDGDAAQIKYATIFR